jgi:seryl-tRNA synthetase
VIDAKLLRENPDVVRAALTKRGESTDLVDQVLAADGDRRSSIAAFESLRAEQKGLGKQVAQAKGDERTALLERTKTLSAEVKATEAAANEAEARFDQLSRELPNLVSDEAPVGGEKDFVVVEEIGKPRDFAAEGFEPRDHLELGELLDAIDMERGAKVSGARFYFLKGVGALLQLGMLQLAIAQAVENGFTPMITPTLVKPEVMGGTGYLGAHSSEVYHLEEDDLYLVGTSEVPLAGYHQNEILDLSAGPKRYAGWSSCYRREAGSYGKDTRGIIRVHQFDKVEMFSYCSLDEAEAEHQRLLSWEKEMLDKMELAYRVIDTATGDLGASAYRKFDCEAWVPTQGAYRELTSTSNTTDFQARRLNIRHRDAEGKTRPVATLNGTLATTRWIVAILETHQLADGSIRVPVALRPYLGGREVLEPVKR